jgi:hypothetical protein
MLKQNLPVNKPFEGLVHSLKMYRSDKNEKQIRQLYEKAI